MAVKSLELVKGEVCDFGFGKRSWCAKKQNKKNQLNSALIIKNMELVSLEA